jgi:hypothetical protein
MDADSDDRHELLRIQQQLLSWVTKVFFFWRIYCIFLELERRDALSAVPTYNWRNVPERSCANDDVICVITSAIEDNYIPIEQLTFQSAADNRPASLGQGRTEDCID